MLTIVCVKVLVQFNNCSKKCLSQYLPLSLFMSFLQPKNLSNKACTFRGHFDACPWTHIRFYKSFPCCASVSYNLSQLYSKSENCHNFHVSDMELYLSKIYYQPIILNICGFIKSRATFILKHFAVANRIHTKSSVLNGG